MSDQSRQGPQSIEFGPFRLYPVARRLEREGVDVELGSRAFDLLLALIERSGEVVDNRELLSRVWPNLSVEDANLRTHVVSLRKALGDGQDNIRYIVNVRGRGYCFVAPVTTRARTSNAPDILPDRDDHHQKLPPRLSTMVGREDEVRAISDRLTARRFVTIHGAGGIGKTTVAAAIAHALIDVFDGAIYFFDLGSLNDPHLLASALAASFGLIVKTSDPTPGIINLIRNRRLLLILDNCEHVIDTAAPLAERIFQEAPQVFILATSREALRVRGEHVFQLPALDFPPEDIPLTAARAMAFPAIRLFVERAAAVAGREMELADTDAPFVAEICRKSDGIALAIELVAGKTSAYGMRELADLLDKRLGLLWQGRRTAPSRHQTLNAMLDWSHDLISEPERIVLRRLSIFPGVFTPDAIKAVVADDLIDEVQAIDMLGQLVAKSLVVADREEFTRYRLLAVTRAYAQARLAESGEADAIARRHADCYRNCLERNDNADGGALSPRQEYLDREYLDNVRAALEWCFSSHGDTRLGTQLAADGARLFSGLSLFSECRTWCEKALRVLDETARGGLQEMDLQAGLSHSLILTEGNSEQAYEALLKAIQIAATYGDLRSQFKFLSRLHLYYRRIGYFNRLLEVAERAQSIAREIEDSVAIAAADVLIGVSHHLIGDQQNARAHLEEGLYRADPVRRVGPAHFAFYRPPQIAMARVLWLQGLPEQAAEAACEAAVEAAKLRDVPSYCIGLIWCVSVFQWIGDWDAAESHIAQMVDCAQRHSFTPYLAVGAALRGEILASQGQHASAVEMLRNAMWTLQSERYELYTPGFNCALAEGLASTGRHTEGLSAIDSAIARMAAAGPNFYMPEMLRVRAEVCSQAGNDVEASTCLQDALDLADQQSALSWRLRSVISLARLRQRQGDIGAARDLLSETYSRFTEGFDTLDLVTAKSLLMELNS